MATETVPSEAGERPATQSELALVKSDLNAKIDTGFAAVNAKIDTGLADVRGEIKELRGEIKLDMARQTRFLVAVMIGVAVSTWLALLLPVGSG
jgi:hypothetical protein